MVYNVYGDKPICFQLKENGEYYCIGIEVINYLQLCRETMFRLYPRLFRMFITLEMRQHIIKIGLAERCFNSNVTLYRATEVEDVIVGNDERYRAVSETFSSYENSIAATIRESVTRPDNHIPIRFDIEIEGQKLNDSVLWNINDSFITPEIFAESYCDDFDVNPLLFIPAIAQIIRQKVEAFQKKILDTQCDNKVFIAIEIPMGSTSILEQMLLDLDDKDDSPEQVAMRLCRSHSLDNECVTSITNAISRQMPLPGPPENRHKLPRMPWGCKYIGNYTTYGQVS